MPPRIELDSAAGADDALQDPCSRPVACFPVDAPPDGDACPGRRLLDVAFPSPKFVDHGDGDVTRKPRPASLYYLINLTPSLVLTLVLQLLSAQVFVVIEGVDYSTALYLCVVTATTVGYGDVPIPTDGGRLFAASIMLLDVVLLAELFSTLRTIIAARSELAKQYRQEQALQNKTLLKRLLWCAHRLRSVDEKSSSTSHRQHAQPAAQQSTKREQDEFYKDLTEDSSAFGISESEFASAAPLAPCLCSCWTSCHHCAAISCRVCRSASPVPYSTGIASCHSFSIWAACTLSRHGSWCHIVFQSAGGMTCGRNLPT